MSQQPISGTDSVAQMRSAFPILQRQVHAKPLVYLDNAATTQKPQIVIDAISDYYARYNSNVHRAAHQLADEATRALEEARSKVAALLGAPDPATVVFTRGTTEAINLVAWGLTGQIRISSKRGSTPDGPLRGAPISFPVSSDMNAPIAACRHPGRTHPFPEG